MKKISVVVCDDVEDVRDYIVSIINREADMQVVGVANSEKTALGVVEETVPDVVLMDIQMETEKAGIFATEKITKMFPSVKTVIITVHADDENILDAYAAGAVDYIIKTVDGKAIAESIRKVYREEYFIGPLIAQKLHSEFLSLRKKQKSMLYIINELTSLSTKETEILKLLYYGNNKRKITEMEHIEMSTVKFHINNILRKLNYKNTNELIKDLKELKIFEDILK